MDGDARCHPLIHVAMLHLRPLLTFGMTCLALTSCERADVPAGPPSSTRTTETFGVSSPSAAVFVVVVDDADTPEAAMLRNRAAASLLSSLEIYASEAWGSCGSMDPAVWHPADLRVVIVRPSAPDELALRTWADDLELALQTNMLVAPSTVPLAEASIDALADRLASPGEAYRPLRATKRALELVTGARPAESDEETALVASLGAEPRAVNLLIASTRDDESGASVSDWLPIDAALDRADMSVVIPSENGNDLCTIMQPESSRLSQWATETHSPLIGWPCDVENAWSSLLEPRYVDCLGNCLDPLANVAEDGSVSCIVTVDQEDLTQCDLELGRRDPDGQVAMVEGNGQTRRRCEVVQLEGEDLELCRTSLECPGCSSGFCATEVPALTEGCSTSSTPLRFIGGTGIAGAQWLTITCLNDD